ncbi:MAG: GLPGLI family protein [Bacteroidota bacterium]
MRVCLLLFLCFGASVEAQEGTVRYEVTTQLDFELPPEVAHLADQFPTSQTDDKLLLFSGDISLMMAAPEEEAETEDFESSGMRIMFRRNDEGALHTDRQSGATTERRSFLSRSFLIDGKVDSLAWQITGEAAEFLGYPAYKATTMRDTIAVEAWFTPAIPASVGPGPYGGLPGLVLLVTEDDARRTYIATEVNLDPLDDDALAPPTEGRRVTDEEFRAIVEEKTEELSRGRRGGVFFRN